MLALMIALVLASPSVGASECIGFPKDPAMLFEQADLVFAGTLVKNEHQDRLTFRADRIWKGPKQSKIVVYVRGGTFIGAFGFQIGDRYLLFAYVLPKDEREAMAVPSEEKIAFAIPRPCGSPPPLTYTRQLDKLARGRRP